MSWIDSGRPGMEPLGTICLAQNLKMTGWIAPRNAEEALKNQCRRRIVYDYMQMDRWIDGEMERWIAG